VALRGDMPSGMGPQSGELHYASDLVRFIREHSGDWFNIEVAAYPETHPQATTAAGDLDRFVEKVSAGAISAITQYFFNADAYFDFVERARAKGVTVPIVPGVMPITNFNQLRRFSEGCGAEIPRWIAKRMQAHGDDADSVRALGAEVVAQLCRRLLDGGAPGLHFYTLNRARATQAVLQQLF
jgi:methylenetetrahydrofolate reductase (NADPH)